MADVGMHVKSTVPRLTLDHCVGNILIHLMLFKAFGFELFDLRSPKILQRGWPSQETQCMLELIRTVL